MHLCIQGASSHVLNPYWLFSLYMKTRGNQYQLFPLQLECAILPTKQQQHEHIFKNKLYTEMGDLRY